MLRRVAIDGAPAYRLLNSQLPPRNSKKERIGVVAILSYRGATLEIGVGGGADPQFLFACVEVRY